MFCQAIRFVRRSIAVKVPDVSWPGGETKPLPSYLLAFAVGPFERVDAGKVKTSEPVGIIVTRGKRSWAKYSAQALKPARLSGVLIVTFLPSASQGLLP